MLPSAISRESWVAASLSSALVAALLVVLLLWLLPRLLPTPLLLAPWLLLYNTAISGGVDVALSAGSEE